MAKHLTQNFVDLSNRGLGTYSTAELHLNHGVNGFGVRPLVVMLHKGFPVEVVIMPHAMPQTIELEPCVGFGCVYIYSESEQGKIGGSHVYNRD